MPAAEELRPVHNRLHPALSRVRAALDADRRPGDFDKGQETRASQTNRYGAMKRSKS